jgi:hypothetical protein
MFPGACASAGLLRTAEHMYLACCCHARDTTPGNKQAEKELREKRRQEALAAKRYPIDDLEHLCEELTAAAAAQMGVRLDADAAQQQGHAASSSAAAAAAVAAAAPAGAAAGNQADVQLPLLPPEQLDLTCITSAEPLAPAEALGLSRALYVSDTLTQFAKPLGVKGCSLAELNALLEAAAAAAAVGGAIGDDTGSKAAREALQWLACTYCRLLKARADVCVLAACLVCWRDSASCGMCIAPRMRCAALLFQSCRKPPLCWPGPCNRCCCAT